MALNDSEDREPGISQKDLLTRVGMILLILLPSAAAVYIAHESDKWNVQETLKLAAVLILALFMPLMAYSFCFFREERREAELQRIFNKLNMKEEATYVQMFREVRAGPSFCLAVGLAWTIAVSGLMILFLAEKLGIQGIAIIKVAGRDFPIEGSRLIFGMAFLGAYLWGLQYTFRRYVVNDLIPGVFYSLGIRMLMASTVALLVYNSFASPNGPSDNGGDAIHATLWPALAFLIGAFPQSGLQWLTERIPIFSSRPDPSVRPLPLDMVEGIDNYDRMRLEELGIESCHDLANADFIPLVLKTSYGARELTDWILQAKLFVACGEAVKDLRKYGVRDITALAKLEDGDMTELASQTSATESSLRRGKEYAANDPEIKRLRMVAGKLGEFTELDWEPK